jgi:uncharacterized Zn-binding protein involved in type VI secretion
MPGQPAAKQGDQIVAIDNHLIQPPGAPPPPPVIVTHPFSGLLDGGLSQNVKIEGRLAATVGSTASNTPPHIPIGGVFVNPPRNQGQVIEGSLSVFINGKPATRAGATALTCNDPVDAPVGTVVAASRVLVGG